MDNYTITLNKAQLDIVMEALGEIPLKRSMPVFNEINNQFVTQVNKAQGEKKDNDA